MLCAVIAPATMRMTMVVPSVTTITAEDVPVLQAVLCQAYNTDEHWSVAGERHSGEDGSHD